MTPEKIAEILRRYIESYDRCADCGMKLEGDKRRMMMVKNQIAKRKIEEYRQQPDYPFGDNIHSWDKLEDFESWLDKGGE